VTSARVEGLVVTAVALGYLWETRQIPSLFQMPGVPGPTAFPTMIGVVLVAAGLWRAARGAGRTERALEAREREGHEPEAAAGAAGRPAHGGRFYAMWAVILGYLALMPAAGFPVATAVALAALFVLLGERRVAVAGALSLACTAVLYLGFARGLGVRLPLGLLERLAR